MLTNTLVTISIILLLLLIVVVHQTGTHTRKAILKAIKEQRKDYYETSILKTVNTRLQSSVITEPVIEAPSEEELILQEQVTKAALLNKFYKLGNNKPAIATELPKTINPVSNLKVLPKVKPAKAAKIKKSIIDTDKDEQVIKF